MKTPMFAHILKFQKALVHTLSNKPQERICMFHLGRSGSTVLGDLLNSNSNIFWDGELFYEAVARRQGPAPARKLARSRWLRSRFYPNQPYAYIEDCARPPKGLFYGFETKFYHLTDNGIQMSDYVERLKSLKFRHFIVLQRENYLRTIVSSAVGHATGVFHKNIGSKVETIPAGVMLDVNAIRVGNQHMPLIEALGLYDANFAEVDSLLARENVLSLSYEKHIESDPLLAYQMVCDFLQVRPEEVAIRYAKTNLNSIRSVVKNFDEIANVLHATKFEWMLDD